ncbi:MAG TPA: ADP-ribose-binding protein [Phycisphaerae bacterium]|nr:ADP-ribose-binding protein [Phycisphaerae bacterium]
MIEKDCNLWIESAQFRCIPTTGATSPDGTAIMDAGIAAEAARKFSGLDIDLGHLIKSRGNHVHVLRPGLLSFPMQQYAWAGPSLAIIDRSAKQLAAIVGEAKTLLPRPGCGPGQLNWDDVKKVLEFLPDNVIVIRHM